MQNEIEISIDNDSGARSVEASGALRSLITLMRPHQWIKNLFVFAPLLFGRKLTDGTAVLESIGAFAAFSLLASGLYLVNDVIDAEEDRRHPEKCLRPIAAGQFSIGVALGAAVVLGALAFSIGAAIGAGFLVVAFVYLLLILGYCFYLKRLIILDAMSIAAGFVLRVIGGAVAISVMPSHWLIACTFVLALFLAFAKRKQEIASLGESATSHRRVLEDYSITFLEKVNVVLIAVTIVCYALYTVSPETIERFGTDALIYGTAFVVYGLLRYMSLAEKVENGGNPSRLVLQDKPLFVSIVGWAVFNSMVIYFSEIRGNISFW